VKAFQVVLVIHARQVVFLKGKTSKSNNYSLIHLPQNFFHPELFHIVKIKFIEVDWQNETFVGRRSFSSADPTGIVSRATKRAATQSLTVEPHL
jgi:hypothetical protein